MAKTLLTSAGVGIIAYVVFAIPALIFIPMLFPYPVPYDECLAKLVWVNRLVWEKVLNLGFVALAGLFIGIRFSLPDKRIVLLSAFAACIYQLSGISYVIIRWGFSYYYKNHVILETFFLSAVLCIVSAFIGKWLKQLFQVIINNFRQS